MKTLTAASLTSILCTASVLLYAAPQLLSSGMIELGPLFGLMVVLPTPVGLIASLVGAVAGVGGLVRRTDRTWAAALTTLGQVITWVLAIVIVVWSQNFGTTGWELLALPGSLLVGQTVVAAGLITAAITRPTPQRGIPAV
ncbi:hypothetical protein ABH922_003886 [Rhodococcus sp. 27YEA15]|uniref:hypothetical protein n=1 Tax=Rhodococcus sp. 27YEA15 TaxID=3156259 RepID=UPI003C7CC95E